MRPIRLCRGTALLVFGLWGQATAMPATPAEDSCAAFLPQAERHYGIPTGLLAAIALTESGSDGQPYPWALNVAGQPRMADSYATAASLLRKRDGTPRQDLAVGCMQIHMRYHLASVGTPEWVLRPRNNVWYAASFLRQLHDQYGTWLQAVGHYNASDPAAQNIYVCQVARSLARVAPATAEALSFPRTCGAGPRKDAPAAGSWKEGGWGRVLVGIAADSAQDEPSRPAAGRMVPVAGTVVRAIPHLCATRPTAPHGSGGPVIIRAGKCGGRGKR